MNVIVPRLSGFCPGVKSAEKRLFELKRRFPKEQIYVLGYLINNRKYIGYLETKNVHTADNPDDIPEQAIVVIRTHGIDISLEQKLQKKFRVVDLTCGKVKRVQREIQKYSNTGHYIVVTGQKNHPEIRGLISYAGQFTVIETDQELLEFVENGEQSIARTGCSNILVISQTTGERELFLDTINKLEKNLGAKYGIRAFDSICPVTNKKEQEALMLQKQVEISFVVGDKLSSNAKKLYCILRSGSGGSEVYFIEDRQELESLHLPLSRYRNTLVVSSASTPVFVEQDVCNYLMHIPHSEGNLA